jgi:hypothetical protein
VFTVAEGTYGEELDCASQTSGTFAEIRRPTNSISATSFSGKFQVVSDNEDDSAGVMYVLSSGAFAMTFNPRREQTFDSLRRAWVSLDTETIELGAGGEITLGNWFQMDIAIVAGAGNSTCTITRLSDGVVVINQAFVNAHSANLIDTLAFYNDSGETATCPTKWADIHSCPTSHTPTYGSSGYFIEPQATGMALSGVGNSVATHSDNQTGWKCAFISNNQGALAYKITDKRYFEVKNVPATTNMGVDVGFIGAADALTVLANPIGVASAYMFAGCNQSGNSPGLIAAGVLGANAAYTINANDVVGIAIDGATGNCFFSINGTFIGTQNPVTEANPAFTLPNQNFILWIAAQDNSGSNIGSSSYNLGVTTTVTAPPAGYNRLNFVV